nr:putative retrotransposon protein [Tanacetum cinerariifolium]
MTENVGKLKAKRDIGVFVGYSKESAAFNIYNKQTRKIHESMNVNFDEILEMDSKQFSSQPGLSNLNEIGKFSNPSVSHVSETSKKDLEDLFQNFYDEYFDSSKIMKSSTTNVETSNVEIPSHEEEVFHEVKIAFKNVDSSSRVELIPSKNNYTNKVILTFHKEFSVFSSFARKKMMEYFKIKCSRIKKSSLNIPNKENSSPSSHLRGEFLHIHRSTRIRHAPDHMCLYIDVEEHELGDLGEPANYKAALLDPKFEKWLNAMNVEMKSMKDNEVWVLVELPPNGKTVGNIRAIRILNAIAAYYDYAIWQMNVKIAFLNGYLNEEVYMEQAKGDLKRGLRVSCYTDAEYLMDADVLKSQTGYVFVLNGGVVDWKSAKQSIFAASFAEAEYIDAFDSSKEAVWVRKFIPMLGVVPIIEEPISIYCDNTGAIAIANESGITKGARHFYAKVHYLRKVIEYGNIKLEKVHTDDNLADPFTKANDVTYKRNDTKAEYIDAFDSSKEAVRVRKFISGLGARHFHAKVHYLREVIEYGDIKLEKFTQMTT